MDAVSRELRRPSAKGVMSMARAGTAECSARIPGSTKVSTSRAVWAGSQRSVVSEGEMA